MRSSGAELLGSLLGNPFGKTFLPKSSNNVRQSLSRAWHCRRIEAQPLSNQSPRTVERALQCF